MKLELSADKPLTLNRLDDLIMDLLEDGVSLPTLVKVNLDGNEYEIERIELDTDGVIRIHLEQWGE
jgi:hypothetical protein